MLSSLTLADVAVQAHVAVKMLILKDVMCPYVVLTVETDDWWIVMEVLSVEVVTEVHYVEVVIEECKVLTLVVVVSVWGV